MSIYEKQQEKFGQTCNWLECDSYCHMTKCVKKTTLMWELLDKFRSLGFKHPEFAYELYKDWCDEGPEFKCFQKQDPTIDRSWYDEENDVTQLELKAKELAEEQLKDDEHVKKLYQEARQKYIEREHVRIEKELQNLKEIENEQS